MNLNKIALNNIKTITDRLAASGRITAEAGQKILLAVAGKMGA